MAHRVDLHKELMRLALDSDALTFPPASIRLGAPIKAVDFDSERPSVTTSSGEEFKFDLVLGTDGIKVFPSYTHIPLNITDPQNSPLSANAWSGPITTRPRLSWPSTDG
jgi:hypothetical protein